MTEPTSVSPDRRPVAVQRAIDLLGDVDPGVRLTSVMDLGEGRHTVAAANLVERFGRERDFQIREALTWAVLRLDDMALDLVRRALKDPRWTSRLQAVHTLSKLADPRDAERLIPLVYDPVDCVAARAYWAVAQCGDPVAIRALIGQLGRGTSEHRNSLVVALDHFGAEAIRSLVAAVEKGVSAAVRQHAADCIAYIGGPLPPRGESALRAALDDEDELVRVAALNALGQLRTATAWRTIRQRSSDPGHVGVLARRLAERPPPHARLDETGVRFPPDVAPTDEDAPIGRIWPPPDLGLVTIRGGPLKDRLEPMLALQVEHCRPRYLSRAEVPPGELADLREATAREARRLGRPPELAERIAAGAVEQHLHETVFLEQISVADPGTTIKDLLYGTGVSIIDFAGRDVHPPTT